jgi:hypothetical protein
MALTAIQVSKVVATDKLQKLQDENGFYLLVHPNGGKYWRYDYKFDGKRKTLAIGTFPLMSLVEAREKHLNARKLLQDGVDPRITSKKAKKEVMRKIDQYNFKNIALEYHEIRSPTWTKGHSQQWLKNLEKYAFNALGDKSVADIEPLDVIAVLRTLESEKKFETRDRLGQSIGD